MMSPLNRYAAVIITVAAVMVGGGYLARDYLTGQLVHSVLTKQAQVALEQDAELSSITLDSSAGLISIEQLAFSHLDDPKQQRNFVAERVDLDVVVNGVISPDVLVRHARVYNAEFTLEYIAPGVSNLSMLEQSYRDYVEQRRTDGRSRKLKWNLEHVELYDVRFHLIDYDGTELADVMIPRIALNSLGTNKTSADNFAALLQQVQVGVIEETLKGRVAGEYDALGVLQLVRRELPNSRLVTLKPTELFKKMGKSLIEKFSQ